MQDQPVISVRGEATLEVEPEVAMVSVAVEARHSQRRRTLDRLASRTRQVTDLIKTYGEAVEKLETGPASVRPEFKDVRARERIAGFVGRVGVTVTVKDFAVLGELVARLAGEEMVSVAGPWWGLRPDSTVHRDARLAAVRDAVQRARDYAEAFGGQVAGLVEAADTGLLTASAAPRPFLAAKMTASRSALDGSAEAAMDFEPARQTVTAQVEARFTMTPPDLA